MKKAFITGVTGQDGSYLAELLLEKKYEVHAIIRRSSVFTTQRIDHLLAHPNFKTYHGDLSDSSNRIHFCRVLNQMKFIILALSLTLLYLLRCLNTQQKWTP